MNDNSIIIITRGGVGDVIVCTPVFKTLKETYPERKLIVYCRMKSHKSLLLNNPYIDSLRMLKIAAMWRYPGHLYAYLFNTEKIKYYDLLFQWITPSHLFPDDYNIKDLVYDMFDDLNIKSDNPKTQLYFTEKEEKKARMTLAPYKNVVMMHVHSRSSRNHHWTIEKWEALVKSLPEYTFIQLGWVDEERVPGALDWRGKTNIRDAFCMLKHADSFVGIESSIAHATNAVDLPGVVLFGDSGPGLWGHDNNINIYKKVRCSPCYFYLWYDPCPYNHECMNLITVEEVRNALIQQMEKKKRKTAVPANLELAGI
ncbi:MAG: glycosyltransferase family 9 protein [Chitinophagaceae bacterium]|nr:glycosyltransferase family 9 protein [Chitinophagaceae bacterium]